jgi:hypothetical protein
MLDYIAYLMAERRVVEVARGALPDSPVCLPGVTSLPVHLRTSKSLWAATGVLLRDLAGHLNRSRVLASPSRTSVGGCPAGRSIPLVASLRSRRRTTTDREAPGCRPCRPALDAVDA